MNATTTPPWLLRARARLRELGITQDDLAKPLGVTTRGAVGHYMTGRRGMSAEQLRALARVCRWTMDELLQGAADEQPAEMPTTVKSSRDEAPSTLRLREPPPPTATTGADTMTASATAADLKHLVQRLARLVQLRRLTAADVIWLERFLAFIEDADKRR